MRDSTSVARAIYEAYVRTDRAAIESLVDDDFHFTSPLDNRLDRRTYFDRCWPNSERINRFKFIHVVPHGNPALVRQAVALNSSGKSKPSKKANS
jgi:hypothetical protein